MVRFGLLLALFFIPQFTFSAPRQSSLTVATFNIKNYGRDTDPKYMERRDKSLGGFIYSHLRDADVIVFEEIVDKERLIKKVLNNRMKCQSYEHSPQHIHVMVCYKKKFNYIIPPNDDNYTIEDVTLGRNLRPAVHGILTDRFNRRLAYILGAHLKAHVSQAEVRLEQARIIAEKISKFRGSLPVIITGDFNTFNEDVYDISDLFEEYRFDYVTSPYLYSYRNGRFDSKLDHFWVANARDADIVGTSPVCRVRQADQELPDVTQYNEEISDHCFLKALIRL